MFQAAALLFMMITVVAHAGERPKWSSSSPRADGQYKYYVGRAIDEMNEKEGWRVAKDQAQESAVRENFGVETSIASASYESSKEVSLDKRVSELFPKVRLIDFEQIDSYVEERSGRYSVWIKYRYPIKQVELERERLKTELPVAAQPFNEVGRPELAYSTLLEVTSEPLGIPVFVDSERWGVTPLRVAGVLTTGVHKVKLSHANYQDVESDVVLMKGMGRKIHHRLKPAVGYIKVSSDPDEAEVIVEGVSKGRSPTRPIEVIVGKPKRVEVKAEGYETQIQLVEVQKDEIRRVQFSLNSIKREPAAVESTTTMAPDIFNGDSAEFQRAWVFGLLMGLSGASAPKDYGLSTAQFGLTVEKRFLWYFGLRAGATYDFATEETKTSESSEYFAISGSGFFVGLPIYLTLQDSGTYLMPEFGSINHKRLKDQPVDSYAEDEFIEMKAQRKGLRLGYMSRSSNIDFWVAVHQYDWREYGEVQATSAGITFTWGDGGQ